MGDLKRIGGGVVVLCALVAGCADRSVGPEDAPPPPEPPLASTELPGAAIFECASGETLQVRFDYDPAGATMLRGSGESTFLEADPEPAEFEAYSNASLKLDVGPGYARLSEGGNVTECEGVSRPVGPPEVAGVSKVLRQSDHEGSIELDVGEVFSIALVGVPTAGYQWSPATLPAFLEEAGTTGGATTTAQYLPGFAGGNHWEVLTFRATQGGSGDLVLEERRPFEDSSEPAADVFRISVIVR